MKNITLLLLVFFQLAQAQGNLFVNAENGLNVREGASIDAPIKGKFYYADQVYQLLPAQDSLSLKIDGGKMKGTWMMVSGTNEKQENIQGYVFSGFLTNEYLIKPTILPIQNGQVKFMNIDGYFYDGKENYLQSKIPIKYSYSMGYIDNIDLIVDVKNVAKIEVYQRLDASINFNIHDLECDALRQGLIKSKWEKLSKEGNKFQVIKYENGDEALNKKA